MDPYEDNRSGGRRTARGADRSTGAGAGPPRKGHQTPRPRTGAGLDSGSTQDARGKVRFSRSGAHWFDRTSGLNILLDDLEIPRECWSRAPRYVSIALTNACELRCPFCYAPKVPGRLKANAVLSWVAELGRAGALGIGFGGGEPTAHPTSP